MVVFYALRRYQVTTPLLTFILYCVYSTYTKPTVGYYKVYFCNDFVFTK